MNHIKSAWLEVNTIITGHMVDRLAYKLGQSLHSS